MIEIAFSLPLPPTINNSYATVERKGKQRRVSSKRLAQYKKDVPNLLYSQGLIRDMWKDARAVKYDVTIYFRTMPTQARRADLSNRLKALEDVVSQYLGFDDCFIEEGHFKRGIDARCPRVEGRWYKCS
jgi:Holliday junction resolvase RusA-like endonuclease